MRHAAWIMVVAMGCGFEAPAEINGSYGAQAIKDEDGTKLLTGGDDGDQNASADQAPPATEGQTEGDESQIASVFDNGVTVYPTQDLNLRKAPGTDADILRVMPEGAAVVVVNGVPDQGFIQVTNAGMTGFASYRYLKLADDTPLPEAGADPEDPAPVTGGWREKALAIAANGVGLSYWWGHGKLYDGVAPDGVGGSCSGSCPSCSHGGSYGADCSGFVAKAWVVPSSNGDLETDTHPYGTSEFYDSDGSGKWSTVSKAAVLGADAMVYRSGSSGHVFLYEKGDAWGQPWTFEARGCSYGIVHNIRTSGSAYKAISRADSF